jgi:hypothetical protein
LSTQCSITLDLNLHQRHRENFTFATKMIFYSDNAEILITLTNVVNRRILVELSTIVCECEWEGTGL